MISVMPPLFTTSEGSDLSLPVEILQSKDVVDCGLLGLWCPQPVSCLQVMSC